MVRTEHGPPRLQVAGQRFELDPHGIGPGLLRRDGVLGDDEARRAIGIDVRVRRVREAPDVGLEHQQFHVLRLVEQDADTRHVALTELRRADLFQDR